jgi:hypothetical protein
MVNASSTLSLIGGEGLDADARSPILAHAQRRSGSGGKIEDAPVAVRPAIVDPHPHPAAVFEIGDAQNRVEGQAAMRTGEGPPIEALAIRGALSLMAPPIPGRGSLFGEEGAPRRGTSRQEQQQENEREAAQRSALGSSPRLLPQASPALVQPCGRQCHPPPSDNQPRRRFATWLALPASIWPA